MRREPDAASSLTTEQTLYRRQLQLLALTGALLVALLLSLWVVAAVSRPDPVDLMIYGRAPQPARLAVLGVGLVAMTIVLVFLLRHAYRVAQFVFRKEN